MALTEENTFARNDLWPSWIANAFQKFLSGAAPALQLTILDPTHIQVVAGAADKAAIVSVAGAWRWNEATVSRSHPGGAAGTWDIYAVAIKNKIDSTPDPGTDNTNRAFELRIVEAGKTPTLEAGVVDIYRKIGSLQWSGTAITRVDQEVPMAPTHAHRHATGQPDALAPADIGAAPLASTEPGPWKALEALNKVADGKAGSETLAIGVRLEFAGALARLRGRLKTTGKIPAGTSIFTLPFAARPAANVLLNVRTASPETQALFRIEEGQVRFEGAAGAELAEGAFIDLDGLTWSIT